MGAHMRGAAARGGRALTMALAILVITAGCSVAGFYVGRNILGEQYLKRSAAKLRPRPTAYVAPQSHPTEATVVEEAPTDEPEPEPAAAPPRPRRLNTGPAVRAPQPASSSATSSGVRLQLGCYLDADRANLLLQDLRNRGYPATVRDEKQGQSTLHKVTMESLSPERAKALASDLKREGYDVMVVGQK